MKNEEIKVILFLGDTELGDINKLAKNRKLHEILKSETETAKADEYSFSINWKQFQDFIRRNFDEDPASFLKVGKTRVVMTVDGGRPRFSGFLSSRPARQGIGSEQTLDLVFWEHFARLSGDLICARNNKMSPIRKFNNRPAHLYTQDLINEFTNRARLAGETLNWNWGQIDSLANKTFEYKDFQTVSKALCDAMNNVQGAGKFDVVFRVDKDDYTHHFIDILKPRGSNKEIIIQYPSDGVYKLWSSNYQVPETNDYASEILVSGSGQVGESASSGNTAKLANEANNDFVQEYCYWRVYSSQSNLESQAAVSNYAKTELAQKAFNKETPKISLEGRPIAWGDAKDENNGLALGDTFYFKEMNNDTTNQSGFYRIIEMDTSWDDNGVATVDPVLMPSVEV